MSAPARRAQQLLRCYPTVWRDRYGEELGALLVDDLADRPRCWRRDLDVVRSGIRARLSACGLTDGPVRDRSSAVAVAAGASVCFAGCALSIWTQLAKGWLSTPPHTRVATVSLVVLSVWISGLLMVSAALGLRMAAACMRTCRNGAGRLLRRPLLTLAASVAVLIGGLGIVAATAPGSDQDGVLARAASIGWAATQPISTYWFHPSRLVSLPALDIAWMLICPVAVASAGWSLLRLARVVGPAAPRRDRHASAVGNVFFLPCLAGASVWVIGSQHAANLNYRAGTLDLLLIGVMAVASSAVRRASTATG